jgi:5'-deoxynucleotidase YfbR-like HD superfamily hydrolase
MSDETTITTVSGWPIDLEDPYGNVYDLEELVAALSKICRFGGHVRGFYSVAQHSIFVAQLAGQFSNGNKDSILAALAHDLHEACVGDMVAPMKVLIPEYKDRVERHFEYAIHSYYGIADKMKKNEDLVKLADMHARMLEDPMLRGKNRFNREGEEWYRAMKTPAFTLDTSMALFREMSFEEAAEEFLAMWYTNGGENHG